MKERVLKVVKCFLIILGILFLLQTILITGAILGLISFANFSDFGTMEIKKPKNDIKEMAPVVKYVEKYYEENNVYPDNINELISNKKLDKKYDYNYTLSKDKNCYSVEIKSKKSSKIKQYQECSTKTDNSSSYSQVYMFQD